MPTSPNNAFLALMPDDATLDRLTAVTDRLKQWDLPAAWSHADDLHLTAVYLGTPDDEELAQIPAAISEVADAVRVTGLRLAGLGATGGTSEPRAVWAAVADPDEQCVSLHQDLVDCLEMPVNTQFRPHITLCRPDRLDARAVAKLPLYRDWPHLLEAHVGADWGLCTFARLALCRSVDNRVPRYVEVTSWPVHR